MCLYSVIAIKCQLGTQRGTATASSSIGDVLASANRQATAVCRYTYIQYNLKNKYKRLIEGFGDHFAYNHHVPFGPAICAIPLFCIIPIPPPAFEPMLLEAPTPAPPEPPPAEGP
jgi:hypothetical protein